MNVAIIPARGGSRRIPRKNIKDFLGKPIMAYSIENAINSGLFDKVIVSTDDDEIAQVAVEYGAEVPFVRPKNLSDDFSGTHEVIGHAVQWLECHGVAVEYACCIYATAPFIKARDLIAGFNLIKTEKWESIIAATNYSYPVFRSFKQTSGGGLKMLFPEHYSSRSQDFPEIYHDAGQFYWAKAETWKSPPAGFNEKCSIVEIPNYRVRDIDNNDDWIEAEFIYQSIEKSNESLER